MAMSDLDNLKSSRRLQAHKTAQKLRLQPIDYVDKSIRTQNKGTKNRLVRRLDIMDRDFKFKSNKMEGERRQFVVDQRRTLKPVFDGLITPSEESRQLEAMPESAFPDMDSDMLRIVEYFEIHKPNTVKRIHTVKHLDPTEEREWLLLQKQRQKAKVQTLNKIGSIKPMGTSSTQNTPRIHVDTSGAYTHRGDMTDKEREEVEEHQTQGDGHAQGFYLSTGARSPEVSASLESTQSTGHFRALDKHCASHEHLNESNNEDTGIHDDEYECPLAQSGNDLIPINILPPTAASVIPDTRPRYHSPPSTKKFRNHKVRTSMSDRGKLYTRSQGNSLAATPVRRKAAKSFTPFSEDLSTKRPIDSADVFGSSDANFKAALTESNLMLHALHHRQNKTPRPETIKRGFTPSLGGSLTGSMENLTIDENEEAVPVPKSRRSPFDVQNENKSLLNPYIRSRRGGSKQNSGSHMLSNKEEHTKAVHETIPENPRKTKPKLFKSRRYGNTYLVPSDVKRTCQDVPFDPYVLAIHKQETDEIETRKRLKDINAKLKVQRQNEEYVQSNVKEWVNTVDKKNKARRLNQTNKGQIWANFA